GVMSSSQQTEEVIRLVRNDLQDCVSLPRPSVTCPYFRRYGMGASNRTCPTAGGRPRAGNACRCRDAGALDVMARCRLLSVACPRRAGDEVMVRAVARAGAGFDAYRA